jgi:hypothetical protein
VELFTRIDILQNYALLQQTKCSPDLPSVYLFATEHNFKTSDVEIGL